MGLAKASNPWRAAAPVPRTRSKAVCVVMRAETLVGLDEEVEALLRELAAGVMAEEPECESYLVTRMMGSRAHFAVHARFATWRAFERHAETEHLGRAMPALAPLLATPISMEMFFEV
jgi:quinol monooxygenase YgiN